MYETFSSHGTSAAARQYLTVETRPFPYGDERIGKPLRDDLFFVVLQKDL